MPRFVILHHVLPPGNVRTSHYDVMFDTGEVLRTWAVNDAPDSPAEQPAERLADHRPEYLTYEGPVSGNRGSVTRWDEGTYEVECDDAAVFVAKLIGLRLHGTVRLTQDGRYSYVTPESPSQPRPTSR